MKEDLSRYRSVLGYSGQVPQPERLPLWKWVLVVLFFVPPVAYLLLLLLTGNE